MPHRIERNCHHALRRSKRTSELNELALCVYVFAPSMDIFMSSVVVGCWFQFVYIWSRASGASALSWAMAVVMVVVVVVVVMQFCNRKFSRQWSNWKIVFVFHCIKEPVKWVKPRREK